jgi:hypothetical protein
MQKGNQRAQELEIIRLVEAKHDDGDEPCKADRHAATY